MRIHSLVAVTLLLLPAAALAGGVECRPVSGAGPILRLAVSDTRANDLTPLLSDGKRTIPVRLAGSKIDEHDLWLDLVDGRGKRVEARLRATFRHDLAGHPAIGTLHRGKRRYEVRCTEKM
ncbi:MAG TPA: hypothetical protein VF535_01525 [Allosphingosinicella sp.]|jgi:hypothetical protein